MANSIVREREAAGGENSREVMGGARGKVVDEIMGDIIPWRRQRDDDFEALWDEFYAKWRGFWMPEHKSYKTERSKLISPLTSMAIDLTSAEIIEAVLGREYFIDLPDNLGDEDTTDVAKARDLLVEDLRNNGFIENFASTVLNGCLYGTGIFKIAIGTKMAKRLLRGEDGSLQVSKREVADIKPVAVSPGAFVCDPACSDTDDMKGVAHEFMMPLHKIRRMQAEGVYYDDIVVGPFNARTVMPNRGDTEAGNRKDLGDAAYITEYYGLVPTRCYLAAQAEGNGTTLPEEMIEAIDEYDMTEVIATIANETHLLRVIENPDVTGERLIVAYQHEVVPDRFHGRGVGEKAANPQRAMDAEMRARIDGLAWSNMPMFAFDLTRMPPNSNLNAWPGKGWGTRGNPNEVLKEFRVSPPDPNSYQHIQDLERMGQQATGALDSASLRTGMRDETATGSALGASSFIKRSKRTMYNIEACMSKLVRRTLHLKMQFEPDKYPQDYEFSVRGAMGMMAREIEQQFMVNLVSVLGPDSPASMPIIRAIFEHSGSPVKTEVLQALKALEEKKPSPEEEAARAAALRKPVAEVELLEAQKMKTLAEAGFKDSQEDKTRAELSVVPVTAELEKIRTLNDLAETDNQKIQLELQDDKNEIERAKLLLQARQPKKD